MAGKHYEEVVVRRDREIGIVTLNAPARRNALSLTMRRELHDVLADLDAEPTIRAIVLAGAGGNFCAGGDLKSMEGITAAKGRARLGEVHQLVRQIAEMSTPIIAAVEGYAYGAGLSIAALCDIVVSAENAQWCCGRFCYRRTASLLSVQAAAGPGCADRADLRQQDRTNLLIKSHDDERTDDRFRQVSGGADVS